MKFLKRFLDFFLYSNIFISVCAATMAVGTFWLSHGRVNWPYIAFVFSSTLSLYNFPTLRGINFSPAYSGRHKWISVNKKILLIIFSIAIIATGILIFFFPLKFIWWFIPVAVIAFAYFFPQTQLRGITGLKTFIVAFVWTCITAVFPWLLMADFNLPTSFTEAGILIPLQNFLFIFPLCLIFNVRDIAADRKARVKTIAVMYGVKITIAVCLISLSLFSTLVILSASLEQERNGLLLSAALSGTLILLASEKRSDYYYSLWIDGMILLQVILVYKIS